MEQESDEKFSLHSRVTTTTTSSSPKVVDRSLCNGFISFLITQTRCEYIIINIGSCIYSLCTTKTAPSSHQRQRQPKESLID
mmetsp:Transcript_12553/g.36530  ORF Transcript_12553/g.36530 Transcript_12553/m.36530 type:complete len:82 (-) Transcript_12553:1809-2054(-)